MLATGTIVAGYRIDGILGRGGMGVVYEATQLSLDRKVALKLIASERGDDDDLRDRFRLEGLRQAAIDHPHIVTVHEAGETEQGLYFAMRLVRGPTLKELIVARRLDVARTLRILSQVADALDTAHEAGLIHRDVKPHNILVASRDHAYLADFGLTKAVGEQSITETGRFVGTLNYVAPEQIRGESVSARTDVYALGAVLYECLTGSVPYREDSQAALLWAHMAMDPPRVSEKRPDLPAALDAVVGRAMAKQPEARFATAGDMLASAQDSLGPSTVAAARPEEPSPKPAPSSSTVADLSPGAPQRSSWHRWAAIAAVLLAVAVAGGGYLFGTSQRGAGASIQPIAAGALRLEVPDAWRRMVSVPTIPGLDLRRATGVASDEAEGRGVRLLAGLADGSGATLLPSSFLDRLPRRPATDDVVALGRLKAYRYRDLRPRGLQERLTLFVVPTEKLVAMIACLQSGDAGASAACERAAATLELDGLRSLPLGPRDDYAQALNAVLRRLNRAREPARAALRRNVAASRRAGPARTLSRAFEKAAAGLATVPAGPAERPAHRALRDDARGVADAYARLAAAAGRRSVAGFRTAIGSIRRREARFERDLRTLRRLGYAQRSP